MADSASSGEDAVREAYAEILNALFAAALEAAPFDTACALLRVGGLQSANWDFFEESRAAFEDFNWMLEATLTSRGMPAARRVGLLMHCQAVEMTAPHEILANLCRCVAHEPYVLDPFGDLARHKKGKLFSRIPPSAKQKFRRIKELAQAVNMDELSDAIDRVFDDRVRNAFSHSDYVLTDEHFRFTQGGVAQQIEVESLDRLIAQSFGFYGAFMMVHREWLRSLGRAKRFHKWPNYEVLELLASDVEGLYGFSVHFSNGSKATYTRQASGTQATNILFEDDGSINYMVGMLDDLEPVWKVDGKAVEDWDALG